MESQSTKMKLKNRTTGKIVIVTLILGAVLACTAPFVHMLFPVKSNDIFALELQLENELIAQELFDIKLSELKKEQKFVGFSNQRTFWFAIGKPILILYVAIYLLFIYPSISDKYLQKSTKILAFLTTFITMYFIIWTLWYRADFPKQFYYLSIGIASVTGTFVAAMVIDYRQNLRLKIEKPIHFISIDAYTKYVQKDDRPDYMKDSYEVYDETIK
ncbi:hypothetical protein MNBD_BACTEROID03-2477 [hydrothermal vent metagenome]|uniref:Uncharacterized protein n=1 Tax=hydrothermal vent metagenome TaxID=652676 RepID=A0A3B0SWQ5_9ZZZZ